MSVPFVGWEVEPRLDWLAVARTIEDGHRRPRAQVEDVLLTRPPDALLNRSAWIAGFGLLVKAATVFPGNAARGGESINGVAALLSDRDGTLEALVDLRLLTKWKTAGDSLLGALRLARPDAREVLVVGAGTVARSLLGAYRAGFPEARLRLWSRRPEAAAALAAEAGPKVAAEPAPDLERAVREADIVSTCTMATAPLVLGDWLKEGAHLDLVGAYRPDMRECDDRAVARARVFCDLRHTALVPGDLAAPIASGAFSPEAVVADLYDGPLLARRSPGEVTLFKNGGGAHLDLMTARHILEAAA